MATAALESSVEATKSPFLPPTSDGRARFTRATYHRMYEAGVFGPAPRVELLDGEIMMMSPIGPLQGALVRRLMRFFVKNLPDSIECSVQLPIAAEDHSEPEPDIALVRHREDDYQVEHPTPPDVVLLIEVAQSSLKIDLGRKLQLYASIGIHQYWVVDIANRAVLIHREPAGASYKRFETFGAGATIAPDLVPNCRLDLDWLFR
jgi:Uma2 family endonuclease